MKKGFTLIELLVVVLIIAILTSVALPQYQKAVDKARGTEALTALNALEKAQTVYYLENREFAYSAYGNDKLAIELPEMKHFYGSNPSDGRVTWLVAKKGDAKIVFSPYTYNGKPQFQRYCLGSDCKNYFSCNMATISLGCGGGSYSRCDL